MKYTVRAREGETQTISVQLDATEVTERLRTFYMAAAQNAGLKPAAGLTAKQLVEQELDHDEIGRSASETVASRTAPAVLDQAGIDIMGVPNYGCYGHAESGKTFAFDIVATVKPNMKLDSYGPVALPEIDSEVDEGDIDDFVSRVARYHPDSVADESINEVGANSLVSLAMETWREGERVSGLCFEEREYQLGKGDMPEGFDEGILGARVGETRTVEFSAPVPNRRSRGVFPVWSYTATATVKAILKQVEPTIDDAWVARNITACASVAQLREKARRELQQQATEQSHGYLLYRAADAVSQRLTEPVPDSAFASHYAELLQGFRGELVSRGITEQDYLSENNMGADELKHRLMSQTREQVRQGLALDAMARHHGIKITQSELKAYLGKTCQGNPDETLNDLKAHGGLRRAEEAALRAKTNEWLVETARPIETESPNGAV